MNGWLNTAYRGVATLFAIVGFTGGDPYALAAAAVFAVLSISASLERTEK